MPDQFIVTLLPVDHELLKIETFGPYATKIEAEQARRRIHFDAVRDIHEYQKFPHRYPRTFVTQLKAEVR